MAGQGKQTSAERRKQKAAEARAKAQAESRKRRLQVVAGGLAVALVAGGAFAGVAALTGDDDDSDVAEPAATPSAEPTVDQTGVPEGKKRCAYPDSDTMRSPTGGKTPGKPPELADATGKPVATVKTSGGPIEIQLDAAAAPCTVNSFVHLAKAGFYDKTTCHRLLDNSTGGFTTAVLQCGDPQSADVQVKGNGGPGYSFQDENLEGARYKKGVVAMANSGPNTNGSQFFIMFKDSDFSPDYVPFGTVSDGLEVVEKVAEAGTVARTSDPQQSEDVPKKPLTLEKIAISGEKTSSTATPSAEASPDPEASETPTSTEKPKE